MSEHGLGRLGKNVVTGIVRHRLRHVGIADRGFAGCDVLVLRREVVVGVGEVVLLCANQRQAAREVFKAAVEDAGIFGRIAEQLEILPLSMR